VFGLVTKTTTTLAQHASGLHVHAGLGALAVIAVVMIGAVIFFADRRRKA
jgi:hypothetical protein